MDDETLCSAVEEIESNISKAETVQYFQFDIEGNMYVFAPGSGCMGEAMLVRPGDELVFSSNYDTTFSENWPPLPRLDNIEEPVVYTCPMACTPKVR